MYTMGAPQRNEYRRWLSHPKFMDPLARHQPRACVCHQMRGHQQRRLPNLPPDQRRRHRPARAHLQLAQPKDQPPMRAPAQINFQRQPGPSSISRAAAAHPHRLIGSWSRRPRIGGAGALRIHSSEEVLLFACPDAPAAVQRLRALAAACWCARSRNCNAACSLAGGCHGARGACTGGHWHDGGAHCLGPGSLARQPAVRTRRHQGPAPRTPHQTPRLSPPALEVCAGAQRGIF